MERGQHHVDLAVAIEVVPVDAGENALGLDHGADLGRELRAAAGRRGAIVHFVGGVHPPQAAGVEREHDQVGNAVAVHVGQRVQHPAPAFALRHVVPPPAADPGRRGKRGDLVRVEGDPGREGGAGLPGEQIVLVLEMDREVVFLPEHEVASTIPVVVHLVNPAALLPGPVPVAVGAVDAVEPGRGADRYRIRESPARHLDQHLEAVAARNDQVVAAIAVQVAGDVHMGDLASARRVEVGSDRDQRAFRRRSGIEPVQATGVVGDQPVAAADVGDVNEGGLGTQRGVDFRRPITVREREDAQAPVVVLIDMHDREVRHRTSHKEPGQDGLALAGAGDHLVPLEGERHRLLGAGERGGRPDASVEAQLECEHRESASPIVPRAAARQSLSHGSSSVQS